MTLDHFIVELLKDNDCVVVPNFGGFITNYKSAVIDRSRGKIHPPSKSILFNSKLADNDGLLANYVTRKRDLTYLNALKFIDTVVVDWRKQLKAEHRIEFGEIGYLFEKDGQVQFEQSRDINLLLSAYGLSSIKFIENKKAVIQETKTIAEAKTKQEPVEEKVTQVFTLNDSANIEHEQIKVEDTKVVPLRQKSRTKRRLGYIAAACLLPALFYSYWIPMETDFLATGSIQMADFNPLNKYEPRTYVPRLEVESLITFGPEESFNEKVASIPDEVTIYNYQFDDELYIPVRLDRKSTEVENSEDFENEVTSNSLKEENLPIQLIAGCFSIKDNAYNLIGQLKSLGYSGYILDKKNSLYRVAAGGFDSMSDAKSEKRILKDKAVSTWVLKQ